MKKVEYLCDVCGDSLRKERNGKDIKDFVAYEFGQMSHGGSQRHRFVRKQAYEVERHLCLDCLRGFVEFARNIISLDSQGRPD